MISPAGVPDVDGLMTAVVEGSRETGGKGVWTQESSTMPMLGMVLPVWMNCEEYVSGACICGEGRPEAIRGSMGVFRRFSLPFQLLIDP